VTDFKEFADRGHSLALDHGWREVADYVVAWLKRHSLWASGAQPRLPVLHRAPVQPLVLTGSVRLPEDHPRLTVTRTAAGSPDRPHVP
jgi:hypothetical protein